MDIILIPGFWLDGDSWSEVAAPLRESGHTVHPLTLPGLESKHADRSSIGLRNHIDAVVAAIDALPAGVVLVGHSGGGAIAYGASDQRADRIARIIYVDSGPLAAGGVINDELPEVDGEVPLPDFAFFDDESLTDMDDAARARFRAIAVPEPTRVTSDKQVLSDDAARLSVPSTLICCEVSSEIFGQWIAGGHPYVAEVAKLVDYELVDLPTGHWPQFTKPAELAQLILAAVDRG